MRACRCACFSILLLGAAPVSASAQAAAEAALGAGSAATLAAPLKNAGKRIGAALDKAGKSLETGKAPANAHAAVTVVRSPAPLKPGARPPEAPKPPVSYEDAGGIKAGMEYEEVLRRFGPPLITLTGASGAKTLSYAGKQAAVDAEVREGKVVSVSVN